MHNVGFILRIYEHIKVASFDKMMKALDECTHQELSNLIWICILFPKEYDPGQRNMIEHALNRRFHGIRIPFVIKEQCEVQINMLKNSGFVRNRLYENGADIVINGSEIGEII